jgi:hypothetical protein
VGIIRCEDVYNEVHGVFVGMCVGGGGKGLEFKFLGI